LPRAPSNSKACPTRRGLSHYLGIESGNAEVLAVNPITRFFEGFAHGYNIQRSNRLQREAQARKIEQAKRIENTVTPLKIRDRVMTAAEVNFELDLGAKFVVFPYCVSVLIYSFKRPSRIYFLKRDDNALLKGMPFSLISILFGWWGIPWGPIWTIETLIINFSGGKNITPEIVTSLNTTSSMPSVISV